jgi:ABC-type polar amino acid transport system ATPase subunit
MGAETMNEQGGARPIVRIEALRKSFGALEVLKGVDLEVYAGQKVTLIGPSGSGKTTLLRCINYLEVPTSGHVYLDGELVGEKKVGDRVVKANARELARIRQRIGIVFQRFNLFEHLTALENVTIGPVRVLHRPREEAERRGRELLQRVGLSGKEDSYPFQLSGGQQQRVAIARALAMDPEVMLFDEATSALDPEMVGEVLSVMRQLASEGMTMIIITHEMKFAESISDHVVFMADGMIVEQGPPATLFGAPSEPRTRDFLRQIGDR